MLQVKRKKERENYFIKWGALYPLFRCHIYSTPYLVYTIFIIIDCVICFEILKINCTLLFVIFMKHRLEWGGPDFHEHC